MPEYQVSCINKSSTEKKHEHITHVGNVADGWRMKREDVIALIDAKTSAFYTVDYQTMKRIYIGVVRGDGNKAPYLRTHADGKWNDNLLALTDCSNNCKLV